MQIYLDDRTYTRNRPDGRYYMLSRQSQGGIASFKDPKNLVSVQKLENVAIVSFKEPIDLSYQSFNTPGLKEHILSIVSDKDNVIYDFSNVKQIDSGTIGSLVLGVKRKKKEGSVVLIGVNEIINDMFKVTNLINSFPIFGSLDEAIKAFQVKPTPTQ